MKQAIILAGGMGTRLSHVISDTQKVMAPIAGRPFLAYLLDSLISKGFDSFILAVGFKHEQIYNFFGTKYKNAQIIYSEENAPLGTGGAIKKALALCEANCVLIVNGDTFFDADTEQLFDFHIKSGADITIAAKKMHDFSRYGTVTLNSDGRVVSFNEKQQCGEGLINGGIYVINKSCFNEMEKSCFSFEKDVLEKLSLKIYAQPSNDFFVDIGIPEDYFDANTKVPLRLGQKVFKAAFLDRDGVICKEKHHLYKAEDFEFTENAPQAMEILREKGYLIIVISNQAGVAKGLYTENDVKLLHEYMFSLLKNKTRIDAVYYSPYHKAALKEEYRKDSYDRKPMPGMIEKAVRDFNMRGIKIDIGNSLIIGDTEKDMQTGVNAGIGTKVLVRSGHKIENEAESCADLICDSLYSFAVKVKTS